ncbi:sensor histidine kinase [Gloeobacter violaceus]|uniref:histidine kinase n=1 Tax=Gloeobacter violaceus (strain ATCC 29082 / PCC 7421) TaxID=251221 RepID=Q7NLZ4_GLOVI|nr:ATP-binding protein [Gloeobacter violaceus]BAC88916.1 glr0975 [Gloeobacter violaceus PCC 7421]
MQTTWTQRQLRKAVRRTAKLLRRQAPPRPLRAPPRPPRPPAPVAPRPQRDPQAFLRQVLLAVRGIGLGIFLSAAVLWILQLALPQGQYHARVQIPLARHWGLLEREVMGWSSYAEALVKAGKPDQARSAYGIAQGLLDTRAEPTPTSLELQRRLQEQTKALDPLRGKVDFPVMMRPGWGETLLQLARAPFAPDHWLDALVAYPLVQEPQIAALLVLSLWLALSFVHALQNQMAWTRILDQERPLSIGRVLPLVLGAALLALLLAALVTLSPSEPVIVAVVCGAAVPGLFVQILNRAYQLRARRALAAWESQHRAEFSSELHNTAQQSIMAAQGLLREIIHDLEASDDPEAGHYAWRLAEAMERCQEVENELRVLRNGTEDKFARGQAFADAIEPICDRLIRRGVDSHFHWLWEGQPVDAATWGNWALNLAESARDRRIAATFYQVLSELTWNVIKYACLDSTPVHVDVVFNCTRQKHLVRYTLEVSDNGPGFDVQSAQDRRPHSGIFSLERYLRRVEIVGAQAHSTLHTAPGQGTRVITEIVATAQRA